jgi:hypothetical protein
MLATPFDEFQSHPPDLPLFSQQSATQFGIAGTVPRMGYWQNCKGGNLPEPSFFHLIDCP